MSDSVPGFRDTKMKTIQSIENRGRENFSLSSLCESYKKKKQKQKTERDILLIMALLELGKTVNSPSVHQ